MTAVELWASAQVLDVRIELAPADAVGVVETLAMRLLDGGIESIADLAKVMAMPQRIILDLVGDLWRAGNVIVNFGADPETIRLSPSGRQLIADLRADESAPSSERAQHTTEVLLEKLTGRVRPIFDGLLRRVDRSLIVPPQDDDRSSGDVRPDELSAAVNLNMSRTGDELSDRSGMKVVAAHLVPGVNSTSSAVRYVPLEAQIGLEDGDILSIEVTEPTLGLEDREAATRRLRSLLVEAPQSQFVRTLRKNAARRLEPAPSVDDLLVEFATSVAAIGDAEVEERQSRHDVARDQATTLIEHARALAAREMPTTVLRTSEEHEAEILRILRDVQQQVVFAVPWIRLRGLKRFTSALTDAVTRGVTVIMLWGVESSGQVLDRDVIDDLVEIERAARRANNGGALMFHRTQSAHIHAKVVIGDDRWAVVTSKNFFSGTDYGEVGVAVSALGEPGEERASPVIDDLLRWAHSVVPYPEMAQRLIHHRAQFGKRDDSPMIAPPLLPRWEPRLAIAPRDDTGVLLWAQAWRAVVAELRVQLERPRPVVHVVADGAHQAMLREAAFYSTQRLVVTSDRLSSHALTNDLIRRLREPVERGVDVRMAYWHLGESSDATIAEELAAEVDGRAAHVTQIHESHAKVVVADDVVYVGSYNYLAFDGSFRRGRFSGEVSLQIDSAEVSDQIAAIYGSPAFRPGERVQAVAEPTTAAARAARELDDLLSESPVAPSTLDQAMDLILEVGIDEVLEALDDGGTSGVRTLVLAAVVARTTVHPEVAEIDAVRWRTLLVDALWAQGDWAAAHAIRASIREPMSPSLHLTASFAASPADLAAPLGHAALDDELPVEEADALALLGVAVMLTEANPELQAPLQIWRERLADDACDIIDAALAHATTYGAIPRDAIVAASGEDVHVEVLSTLWHRLEDAVNSLRSYSPKNELGAHVLATLFTDGEEMAKLDALVVARDEAGILAWHQEFHQPDDSRWLTQVTRRAGSTEMLDGRRRISFTNKRMAVRKLVTSLVDELTRASSGSTTRMDVKQAQIIERIVETARIGMLARVQSDAPEAIAAQDALDRILTAAGFQPARPRTERDSRFPHLRAHEMQGTVSAEETAALTAEDVVTVRLPGDEIEVLLSLGELGLAAEAVDELERRSLISGTDLDRAKEGVEEAYTDAAHMLEQRVARLRIEAELAGVSFDDDPVDLQPLWRLSDINERLEPFELSVRAAIAEAASKLDDTDDPHVNALIAAGELLAAAEAMRTGGFTTPIDRGVREWDYVTYRPAQIAYHLRTPGDRQSWFGYYEPSETDDAGWAFVDAVERLGDGEPNVGEDYVLALQRLVDPEAEVTFGTTAGGQTATFTIPVPDWLEGLLWTGRHVVTVAIGDSTAPAAFRISGRLGEDQKGSIVLDLNGALSLLNAKTLEDRQLNLLRYLGGRMAFDAMIDQDGLPVVSDPESRAKLAWIFFVLKLDIDPMDLARLIGLTGHHPFVLWSLLAAHRESGGPSDFSWLGAFDRLDEQLADIATTDDIATSSTLVVLAAVIEYGTSRGLSRDDVDLSLDLMVPNSAMRAWIDVDASLELLVDERYLDLAPGGYRLPTDAVSRALSNTSRRWLPTALDHLADEARVGPAAQQIKSELIERIEHARKVLIHELPPRQVRKALAETGQESEPLDVAAVIRTTAAKAGRDGVTILPIGAEDSRRVTIEGRSHYLDLLLRNAVNNAVDAAAGSPKRVVHVRLVADADSVVVVVADSGSGFPANVLSSTQAVESTRHDGLGRGLVEIGVLAAELGATVERGVDDILGGARLTFVFAVPSAEPPAP